MKKHVLLFFCFVLLIPPQSKAWGFYAHKKINELAIYTLPAELFGFYKFHMDYVREHAVDADKRRYRAADEACKHYLDGDFYERSVPIDTIPFLFDSAVAKYTLDTVLAHGIVTWNIQTMLNKLTYAFKTKNYDLILKYSADIGHYIGDCHVPLHACSNYNGQKTGQNGIHGLWESRIPELFCDSFDLWTAKAIYIEKPLFTIWKAYEISYFLSDSVLRAERNVTAWFPADKKYTFEQRGNLLVKNYSPAFCAAYHKNLGNMVESRMKESAWLLGCYWYTAWINAGQPELEFKTHNPTQEKEENQDENHQKMIGRPEE